MYSAPAQFRSKEITKASVVDDMVESNSLLYKPLAQREADSKDGWVKGKATEHPDHCIVIKVSHDGRQTEQERLG